MVIPIGTYSRHYYDLYQLGQRREVLEMLRSDEYTQIKEDYEQVSLSLSQRLLQARPNEFRQ